MTQGVSTGPISHRYESASAWREVDEYFIDELVPEDEALIAARKSGSDTTMPDAEVAANQGAFLALLAQIAGARSVLEFGTLAGYSTIWFARAVGPAGHVVTFEVSRRTSPRIPSWTQQRSRPSASRDGTDSSSPGVADAHLDRLNWRSGDGRGTPAVPSRGRPLR